MHRGRGLAAFACAAAALVLAACTQSGTATTTSPPTTAATTTSSALTTTTLPPSTTTSSTTTTVGVTTCVRSGLGVETGKSSGAAGTVALGFVVTNISSTACTLQGYPALTLVPKSGSLSAAVSHTGAAPLVTLAAAGEAGFVMQYSDVPVNGQATCPAVVSVEVALPHVSGDPIGVAARFDPCGQPDVTVSGVLSLQQYKALIG